MVTETPTVVFPVKVPDGEVVKNRRRWQPKHRFTV
jgi:hypothetical protein